MREPSVVIITILLLVACSFSDAGTAPAEEYWKKVMGDVPMPQSVKDLIDEEPESKSYGPDAVPYDIARYNDLKRKWLAQYITNKMRTLARDPDVYNNNRYFTREFDTKRNFFFYEPRYTKEFDTKRNWLDQYLANLFGHQDVSNSDSSNERYFTKEFGTERNWFLGYEPPSFTEEIDPKRNWLDQHLANLLGHQDVSNFDSNNDRYFTKEFDTKRNFFFYEPRYFTKEFDTKLGHQDVSNSDSSNNRYFTKEFDTKRNFFLVGYKKPPLHHKGV